MDRHPNTICPHCPEDDQPNMVLPEHSVMKEKEGQSGFDITQTFFRCSRGHKWGRCEDNHEVIEYAAFGASLCQREPPTPEAFAKRYAERSKVSLSTLADHKFVVLPCTCDYEECRGWQMQDMQWIATRIELGLLDKMVEYYPVANMIEENE